MEAISISLRDPSWWFSVVFVAVVSGVGAGFLKDYLERKYHFYFAWTQAKRVLAAQSREVALEAWSADAGRVLIVLVRSVLWMTVFVGAVTLVAINMNTFRAGITALADGRLDLRSIGFVLLLLLLTRLSVETGVQFSRTRECLRRFRIRSNLPRLFHREDGVFFL